MVKIRATEKSDLACGDPTLDREPLQAGSCFSEKDSRSSELREPFHLKIEREICASVRGAACCMGARIAQPSASGSQVCGRGRPFKSVPRPYREFASILAASQKVYPGQTATLERVLRATAQYSICGWGEVAPSTTTSRSSAHQHLKAAEPHLGRLLRYEQGSGVSR
jgi:hypothetical protein